MQALLVITLLIFAQLSVPPAEEPLRIGHFPNITHAQGVIAHELSRQGKGWFEKTLGTTVEWYVYNAGPEAMEALMSGAIDMAYVGPNPALNAFIRSKGRALHIVSGAARGGSALVIDPTKGFTTPLSFKGKRVATPQFGNTQDVSARAWFMEGGLSITQSGGDLSIIPTANPDQLALFLQKELDAVWTVEPWVSRLELEAKGQILIEEKDALTTVMVSSARALKERKEIISAAVKAHHALTAWLTSNTEEAQQLLASGLKATTRKEMPAQLIAQSWKRLKFDTDVQGTELQSFLLRAQKVGFLRDAAEVSTIVKEIE